MKYNAKLRNVSQIGLLLKIHLTLPFGGFVKVTIKVFFRV